MKKEDCRVGMVVYDRYGGSRAVVVKCNPKNARVRIVEGNENRDTGALWNIPYRLLDPVVSENLGTEMVMRSFEQPENQGIKTYFANVKKADDPVHFPEGSPEWHVMRAVCELWRRLEDESIWREVDATGEKLPVKKSAMFRAKSREYSNLINKLFSALGREVSKSAAAEWESGSSRSEAV